MPNQQTGIDKAQILTEALPYIQRFAGKTLAILVKLTRYLTLKKRGIIPSN